MNRSKTLLDLLHMRAVDQPHRLAYRFLLDGELDEATFTYDALNVRARAIGAELQSISRRGDRVLLLIPPGLDFIAAFFGCFYAGTIAVPSYPPHPARIEQTLFRIMGIIHDATPSTICTTTVLHNALTARGVSLSAISHYQWLIVDQLVERSSALSQQQPSGPADIAFLQYTSGSTSAPKGVIVSHASLMHNLQAIAKCFQFSERSSAVAWLPPYHDMGLIGGILEPMYAGFPVALMSAQMFVQRPIRWLQAISRFQATTSGGPNFAYDLCVRKIKSDQVATLDLGNWEVAYDGAEPIHHSTLERFARHFAPAGFRGEAFLPCYGLAEATLIVTGKNAFEAPTIQNFRASSLMRNRVECSFDGESDCTTLVSNGKAVGDHDVRIVDPETLEHCGPGIIGEIWVSGKSISSGYWNNAAESDRVLQARLAGTGEGPFLRTGDFGFLFDGQLFVTGRLKDLIIIDGINHHPQDIERTIEEYCSAIRPAGCAAFSVHRNNREELVVVAEMDSRSPFNAEELVKAVRKAVVENHDVAVSDVHPVNAGTIFRTSSGKIRRQACKLRYLEGTLMEAGRQ